MGTLATTAKKMSGGVTEIAAVAKTMRFSLLGTWASGDSFTITIVNPVSGLIVTIGEGPVTGLVPAFSFTYKRKLNLLCGTSWAISGIDLPTVFNDFNAPGRGVIELADYYAAPNAALAIGPYQGKAIPIGSQSTQVWTVASNLAEYNNDQVLDNTGTIAKLSAQSWGELDFYFLDETGVRSLRSRETTLNAVLTDIGSPIDIAIQTKLASCTAAEKAAACGIVDPTSGRYMLFIKDTIYVLSNFPSAGVQAWATYKPTYQATDYFRASQTVGADHSFAISMVNDVTKAIHFTAAVDVVTSIAVVPGNYIFLLDSTGAVVASSAIPNGVLFRGNIAYTVLGGWVFTSNQTTFVPQKFFTHKKQVFARASDAMYAYGGTTGSGYDNAVGCAKIPWLELGRHATSDGIDASMTGAWYVYASMDYLTEQFSEVLAAQSAATYDGGRIPFSSVGSRFSMQVVSSAASRALMSALTFKYQQ